MRYLFGGNGMYTYPHPYDTAALYKTAAFKDWFRYLKPVGTFALGAGTGVGATLAGGYFFGRPALNKYIEQKAQEQRQQVYEGLVEKGLKYGIPAGLLGLGIGTLGGHPVSGLLSGLLLGGGLGTLAALNPAFEQSAYNWFEKNIVQPIKGIKLPGLQASQ